MLPTSFGIIRTGKTTLFVRKGREEEVQAALAKVGDGAGNAAFRGRGSVLSLPLGQNQRMLVRHYWHGGMLAWVGRDVLFGLKRPLREAEMTRAALEKGVPTAVPLGIRAERLLGPFSRADFLMEEIPSARDLIELLSRDADSTAPARKRETIHAVARAIRRLHDAGIYHGDLHLKNILVDSDGQAYVIDMDRATLKKALTYRARERNLRRLHRSLVKLGFTPHPVSRADMLRFIKVYAGDDRLLFQGLLSTFRAQEPGYGIHRFFWKLLGVRNVTALPGRRASVSACVITLNEERNIQACLESLLWADEIIVVDSFSTDRTLERAKRLTDKVYQRAWRGINDQRAYTVSKARGEWVLCVDADERVSPKLRREIERELSQAACPYDGFYLPRRNLYHGRWMRFGGWYPNYRLRLFRRGRGRFVGVDPHDRVACRGATKKLKGPLLHCSFEGFGDQMERTDRYSTEAARLMFAEGQRFNLLKMISFPAGDFLKAYVLRLGFLDGMQGLISAIMSSYHVFIKYAKLWELGETRRQRHEDST